MDGFGGTPANYGRAKKQSSAGRWEGGKQLGFSSGRRAVLAAIRARRSKSIERKVRTHKIENTSDDKSKERLGLREIVSRYIPIHRNK